MKRHFEIEIREVTRPEVTGLLGGFNIPQDNAIIRFGYEVGRYLDTEISFMVLAQIRLLEGLFDLSVDKGY